MNKSSFEEILKRDGRLIYSHVGDSMRPLLRDERDLLVIEPIGERPKRYDIVLFRRDSGRAVMHRIIRCRKTDYLLCGDNQWCPEAGITDRHIIGKLTAVIRNGKEYRLAGWRYRAYVFLWCGLFPLRALLLKVRYKLKHLKR
ncbi:MAG: S24/S26 family peptidase [Oscillospiraceae bacterium]|nr:S24/S26 family peptidase [Oscillospiraceae bacterium]